MKNFGLIFQYEIKKNNAQEALAHCLYSDTPFHHNS